MTWIEAIAAVAGLLCVGLLVRQSIWNFPFGIIQVSVMIYLFYVGKLYSDMILHVVYIVLNVYGWIHWLRGGNRDSGLPVTRLTPRGIAGWSVVTVVLTAAWGAFMDRTTDAAVPYADGFILIGSLVAQWLTARKKIESWWLWIITNVVAIPLLIWREYYILAGLYVVFIVLCIMGIREWRHSVPAGPAAASV